MAIAGIGRFARDRGGAAIVELALLAPLFCLLLVGIVDLGGALYTRFRVTSAVSAAANFAVVNADKVDKDDGPALASALGSILRSGDDGEPTTGQVVVNNGPVATVTATGVTISGAAANADGCYCPTSSAGTVSWGTTLACGSACAGGGRAGRFVTVSAQQAYRPLFATYGLFGDNVMAARAVAQVQ